MTSRTRGALIAVVVLALVAIATMGHVATRAGATPGASVTSAADGALVTATGAAASAAAMGAARIGPGVAIAHRPITPATVPPGYYSPAEARAFAAAGQAADGHPEALSALDAPARAALAHMRAELARQAPLVTASTARTGANQVAGGAGAAATPGAHLDLANVDRGIAGAPGSQVITGSQVWALAHLDPSLGKLDIENRSGGDYTISLYGSDFGSVRLNGGLVVPGRAYAVGSSAEITGAAPVAVHIRPAGVATTVYPGPLLPQGDG